MFIVTRHRSTGLSSSCEDSGEVPGSDDSRRLINGDVVLEVCWTSAPTVVLREDNKDGAKLTLFLLLDDLANKDVSSVVVRDQPRVLVVPFRRSLSDA